MPQLSFSKVLFPERRKAIVLGKVITSCKQCRYHMHVVSTTPDQYWCERIKMDDKYKVLPIAGGIPKDCPFLVKSL